MVKPYTTASTASGIECTVSPKTLATATEPHCDMASSRNARPTSVMKNAATATEPHAMTT